MKTDTELQKDVMAELRWTPSLRASEIGVAVKDGVVTLSGNVDSYIEKSTAEHTAQKVGGVRAVVQKIEVRLPNSFKRTDEEVAEAAINALEWNSWVPKDQIRVKVQNGWVTISGQVDWQYQKNAANDAVCCLIGVVGLTNLVTIKSTVKPEEIKTGIENAFKRHAALDAKGITVETSDNKVTLKGSVHSLAEKQEALAVAWAAPGICEVENKLIVSP
jgi:osmotically-inducible protein OsmY